MPCFQRTTGTIARISDQGSPRAKAEYGEEKEMSLDEPTKKEVRKILGALRRAVTLLKISGRQRRLTWSEGQLIHVTLDQCCALEKRLGAGPNVLDPIHKQNGQE